MEPPHAYAHSPTRPVPVQTRDRHRPMRPLRGVRSRLLTPAASLMSRRRGHYKSGESPTLTFAPLCCSVDCRHGPGRYARCSLRSSSRPAACAQRSPRASPTDLLMSSSGTTIRSFFMISACSYSTLTLSFSCLFETDVIDSLQLRRVPHFPLASARSLARYLPKNGRCRSKRSQVSSIAPTMAHVP